MHRAGRCIRDAENDSGRLGDEQREQTEAFGERHGQDRLDEDLAGGAGIAADGFASFDADEADADGGAYHAGHSHFHGHHGFDREALAAQLIEGGFVDPHLRTVYHLRKPVDGVEQDFPLFLAVAQVGQVGQAGPDRA